MPSKFSTPIPAEFVQAFLKLSIRHPHIGKNIKQKWGTDECIDYLNSLLYDKRPGRMGFQRYILVTLMQLHLAHEKLFPVPDKSMSLQTEPEKPKEGGGSFHWDDHQG